MSTIEEQLIELSLPDSPIMYGQKEYRYMNVDDLAAYVRSKIREVGEELKSRLTEGYLDDRSFPKKHREGIIDAVVERITMCGEEEGK